MACQFTGLICQLDVFRCGRKISFTNWRSSLKQIKRRNRNFFEPSGIVNSIIINTSRKRNNFLKSRIFKSFYRVIYFYFHYHFSLCILTFFYYTFFFVKSFRLVKKNCMIVSLYRLKRMYKINKFH